MSPVNLDVNTFASKRSELIENSAIVRKRRVIHIKPIRVSMRPPVAARIINYIKQERKGDMWLALDPLTAILLKYVSVRKLQVAILARSSREMSRTVPSCHEFAFQFGLAFFLDANNSKPIANTASHTRLLVGLKHRTGIVHRSRWINRQRQRS